MQRTYFSVRYDYRGSIPPSWWFPPLLIMRQGITQAWKPGHVDENSALVL